MSRDMRWSRRTFLQGIGYTSALGTMSKLFPRPADSDQTSPSGFAYVGAGGDAGNSAIHVCQICGDSWKWKQSIATQSPVSLALHPSQQYLYVANSIAEYGGLPRGTIEAYKIDSRNGTLTLLNRQPLSLSGINPRHIAVSPDGKYLVVAVHGGGAYNVLPLSSDGTVGRVAQILKEVGAGAHPDYQASAHPHTVVFDATGEHLLATDQGNDRLSVFAFQNGQMTRKQQVSSQPASGPGSVVFHPQGHLIYVSNIIDGSIDRYRWLPDKQEMKYERRLAAGLKAHPHETHPLVISPSGDFLYAASVNENISVWAIDSDAGDIAAIQQWSSTSGPLRILALSERNQQLLAADDSHHSLLSIPVHAESGKLGAPSAVANVGIAQSLILKYA